MSSFVVEVSEINKEVVNFFEDCHNRIEIGNPYMRVFDGYIKRIKETKCFYVYLNVITFKVWIVGVVYILLVSLFKGFILSLWYVPGFFFLGSVILWSKHFHYFMLYIGLKKNTKNIKLRLIKKAELSILLEKVL